MSIDGITRDGELATETREQILAHREELEALAESDLPGAPVAAAILRQI